MAPPPHWPVVGRRQLLAAGVAAAGLAAAGKSMAQTGSAGAMEYRGIVYDTGTDFGYPGYLSRMS